MSFTFALTIELGVLPKLQLYSFSSDQIQDVFFFQSQWFCVTSSVVSR